MKILYFLLIFINLNFTNVYSEPSQPIRELIETPASAFDLYLFSMYEYSKCSNYEMSIKKIFYPYFCMLNISYDYEDNIIDMFFMVKREHEIVDKFKISNDKEKEIILRDITTDIVNYVGIESKYKNAIRSGIIQQTPIRRGWRTNDLNEDKIKEEIINRTRIEVDLTYDGISYRTIRDHHGKVQFEKITLNLTPYIPPNN